MRQITVIGSGGQIPSRVYRLAEKLGQNIAEIGAILITGGKGGVMEAACKGAKDRGGLTVGILPGSNKEEANPFVDVIIVTGMGNARNVINIMSSDVVITVHGGAGTLSEVGLALITGKKVVAIKSSGGVSEKIAGEKINGREVVSVDSVEEAIELALKELVFPKYKSEG